MDTETGRTNELLDRYKLVENKNKILHLPKDTNCNPTFIRVRYFHEVCENICRRKSLFKCNWYINVTFVNVTGILM